MIDFLIKMGTRFGPLNPLIVILCLSHQILFIVIFDVGMSPLINENFLPFEVQQTLQYLSISFSQLQDEFV